MGLVSLQKYPAAMHYQIFGLSQNFEISYRFSTRPNKLGQVGFFGLGSSQNTQWTQVDQVHDAMVPGAAQHNLGPKAKNLCGAFNM